jgi:hypothetical protein
LQNLCKIFGKLKGNKPHIFDREVFANTLLVINNRWSEEMQPNRAKHDFVPSNSVATSDQEPRSSGPDLTGSHAVSQQVKGSTNEFRKKILPSLAY